MSAIEIPLASFPMPNDILVDQGIVVASTWYRDDDEFQLATVVILRPEAPFFRVGVWDMERQTWDGDSYVDHYNIVPAITGENLRDGEGNFTGGRNYGYTDLGGDY